jgi:hypothetical protein
MKASTDPSTHRQAEQRFFEHVERVLGDERLRIDTTRGRKPATQFIRSVNRGDKAVDLKRLMSELRKPDRDLQNRMPLGRALDVELYQKRLWVLRSIVGRLRVVSIPPTRELLEGRAPQPLGKASYGAQVNVPVRSGHSHVPETLVVFSSSGFDREMRAICQAPGGYLMLVEPNDAGGFNVYAPPQLQGISELFDPEVEEQKRSRIREAIAVGQTELSGSGVASDRIAAKTQLPAQLVEAELKSYARENPGLAAKRLDGRVVLFREGSAATLTPGGNTMPMIDKIRSLFARRGETEKKIAFLSERRAALGQQRDRAYEEVGSLEQKDAELREQFKSSSADLAKRRITSQLLQLRKDMERRQQLLGVLNQQINVVSTHLHNLELVQQGQTAKLPDSEEMASDAAAAEEMLATLQESGEMAESVGGVAATSMSAEEQALYEELLGESAASKSSATIAQPPAATTAARPSEPVSPPIASKQPPRRTEPEAG